MEPRGRRTGCGDDPTDVDSLIIGKHNGQSKGKAKETASNRRARERVQALQSLMEHGTSVPSKDTKQLIVGATSVRTETPKAKAKARTRKARTARTRKAAKARIFIQVASTFSLFSACFVALCTLLLPFHIQCDTCLPCHTLISVRFLESRSLVVVVWSGSLIPVPLANETEDGGFDSSLGPGATQLGYPTSGILGGGVGSRGR